jgi:hypothetical protein
VRAALTDHRSVLADVSSWRIIVFADKLADFPEFLRRLPVPGRLLHFWNLTVFGTMFSAPSDEQHAPLNEHLR